MKLKAKIYSVPRRFDLVTIFVATTASALLFAVMGALNFPAAVFAIVVGLFVVVGIAQAVMPKNPRYASMIVGALYYPAAVVIPMGIRLSAYPAVLGSTSDLLLLVHLLTGAALGYLAGTLVGGIFLVADHVRQFLAPRGL